MARGSGTRKEGRDSKSGHFVPKDYVKNHPDTTETETIKNPTKKGPGTKKKK